MGGHCAIAWLVISVGRGPPSQFRPKLETKKMAAHAYCAVVRVQFLSPQHAELAVRVLDVGKDPCVFLGDLVFVLFPPTSWVRIMQTKNYSPIELPRWILLPLLFPLFWGPAHFGSSEFLPHLVPHSCSLCAARNSSPRYPRPRPACFE